MTTGQIVLAWAEKTALKPTGRQVMRDLNWFPEFVADWEGKAAMWRVEGTEAELTRAKEYARTEVDYHVFTFDPSEKDPLGKARAKAVALAKDKEKRS